LGGLGRSIYQPNIIQTWLKIGAKMSENWQKFAKITKNSRFLSTFFVGTRINERKYISRILLKLWLDRLGELAVKQRIGRDFGYC